MGFVPSKFYICCIILAQSKSFTTSIVKFALVVVFMCYKTYIFLTADVLKGASTRSCIYTFTSFS